LQSASLTTQGFSTTESTRYEIPDPAILKHARVEMVVEGGETKSIEALVPYDRIDRFLSPGGEYHDLPSLSQRYPSTAFDKLNCTSCWWLKHDGRCKSCRVCDENNHSGGVCPLLYLSYKFWKDRGRIPKGNVQIRPNEKELAYLIVAGVFLHKPGMHFWDPLVINKDHPIVQKFYNGKQLPRRIGEVDAAFSIDGYGVFPLPSVATNANNSGRPPNQNAPSFAPPPALLSVTSSGTNADGRKGAEEAQSSSDAVQSTASGANVEIEEPFAAPSVSDDEESLSEHVDEEKFNYPHAFIPLVTHEYFTQHMERKDRALENLRERTREKIDALKDKSRTRKLRILELENENEEKDDRIRALEARLSMFEEEKEEVTREGTKKRLRHDSN